jgi:DNA-binding transcriptional ArsR family regulator
MRNVLEAHRVLDALGDPTRRTIFERLRHGPRCVCELAAGLPVTRPAVSQHLKVLKEAGLVVDRPRGRRRYYGPSDRGLEAVRSYLDQFWDRALPAFKEAAERAANKEDT